VSTSGKPSIVFCHGIWADSSCFGNVIASLQAAGYECISAQYPLNTTADDIAIVKKTLSRVSSPSILVGHSYGGHVITGAGTDDRVRGLVYICALGPDEGETAQEQLGKFPTTPVFKQIEVTDGRVWMKAAGIADFCGDLPEAEQKVVWATNYPPAADLFNAPMGTRHGRRSHVGTSSGRMTGPCLPTSSGLCQNAWARTRSSWARATARCSHNRMPSSI
jgi:pimeloyl-ACP methyl ester carboxylesterase